MRDTFLAACRTFTLPKTVVMACTTNALYGKSVCDERGQPISNESGARPSTAPDLTTVQSLGQHESEHHRHRVVASG